MTEKHGNLSIDSDNLFPIIKKWLYSDHDIFYRELISNGCDAITKLKKLDMMGEYSLPADYKGKIQVLVNPDEKTIKIIDNGLGMTADEVEEYISRIAFSGATDFIEKYKDKSNDDQIIGHFGLGFYSAFMVADEVTIDTLSYKEGSTPVHWSCDGGTEYNMEDGDMDDVGTEITLYLNDDCLEFANEYRAREVIEKYCSFMPTEIYLAKENAPEEYETIDKADKRDTDTVIEEIHEDAKYEEKENDKGEKEQVEVSPAKDQLKIVKRPVPLNDTTPLWTKNPNECTDEEYKEFYRKVFLDYKEPLFWIHLNMDYPFNLKGILYFPKINTEYDSIEGTIKLYNNQVFIADNIKEVIPEFLMLLKGVIDCPDLPLNVSRSALQNDGFVKKISDYITNLTGIAPDIYRFPGGSMNQISNVDMVELVKILNSKHITYFDWNVNSGDTADNCSVDDIVNNVTSGIAKYDNSVVLLHDDSNRSTTAEAIEPLVESIKAQGAEILPIDNNTYKVQYIKSDTVG